MNQNYFSKEIFQAKLLFLLCISIAFLSCHTQNTETTPTAPTNFHGIPPQGIGGDSLLNIKKNRWLAPGNYSTMSVADIIALPNDTLLTTGSEDRYKWISGAKNQAAASEAKSVSITGFITAVREEGNESCNGNNNLYHDYHIWITPSQGEGETKAIIAEATPFWREQFSGWQLATLQQLVLQNAQVRVSGWILWDEDHPEQLGSSRASLWEIHPITKFEYFSGGVWKTL